MSCEICGHCFAHRHRLIPGKVRGGYVEGNVADLCPNHHAAIHFLMSWLGSGKTAAEINAMGRDNERRFNAYLLDEALYSFWAREVKPICEAMLEAEREAINAAIAEAAMSESERAARDKSEAEAAERSALKAVAVYREWAARQSGVNEQP